MRVSLVQMHSTGDTERNLHEIDRWVRRAAADGADVVLLPEAAVYRGPFAPALVNPDGGPVIDRLATVAADNGITLVVGGIWTPSTDPDRPYNSCLLFDRGGTIAARYHKIHLFRLDLPDGTTEDESLCTTAGNAVTVATVDDWTVGMSICYDLRFPELYRSLAAAGAHLLLVPANFSAVTGPFHWEPLLRARAIENLCYVMAPAQIGADETGFIGHGASMALDPWGRLLAHAKDEPALLTVDVDPSAVSQARSKVRSPEHLRPDAYQRLQRNELDRA